MLDYQVAIDSSTSPERIKALPSITRAFLVASRKASVLITSVTTPCDINNDQYRTNAIGATRNAEVKAQQSTIGYIPIHFRPARLINHRKASTAPSKIYGMARAMPTQNSHKTSFSQPAVIQPTAIPLITIAPSMPSNFIRKSKGLYSDSNCLCNVDDILNSLASVRWANRPTISGLSNMPPKMVPSKKPQTSSTFATWYRSITNTILDSNLVYYTKLGNIYQPLWKRT